MARPIKAGESTAARRRLYFQLVGTDGITAATGEAGGQPQVSLDGATWAGSGSVGTLTHVGNGRYYADLAAASVATSGVAIESRYKSASTAECPGDSALVVTYDPYTDIASVLALMGSGSVSFTLTSPVTQGGLIRLVRGDDYSSSDGRNLSWSVTTSLDLSTATTNFIIYSSVSEETESLSVACTAAAVTGGYTLTRSLTAAQTSALSVGRYRYEIKSTLSSSRVITWFAGSVEVTR